MLKLGGLQELANNFDEIHQADQESEDEDAGMLRPSDHNSHAKVDTEDFFLPTSEEVQNDDHVSMLQEPLLVAHAISETHEVEEHAMMQVLVGGGVSHLHMPTEEEIIMEEVDDGHSMLH